MTIVALEKGYADFFCSRVQVPAIGMHILFTFLLMAIIDTCLADTAFLKHYSAGMKTNPNFCMSVT